MPNLLSCLRLDAGRRPRLGPDVQRGLEAAGDLVGAGARVAVVGAAVLDAGVLVETRHWYDTSWNSVRFNSISSWHAPTKGA